MDFSKLSKTELANVAKGNYTSDMLRKLSLGDFDQLALVRDEAMKAYYSSKLEECDSMDLCILHDILSLPVHASARQLVGECAIKDWIPHFLLQSTLEALSPSEWSFRQVQARISIGKLYQASDPSVRLDLLDHLIRLRATWALEQVLEDLSERELRELLNRMSSDSKVLNRGNRHRIRERIASILKSRR